MRCRIRAAKRHGQRAHTDIDSPDSFRGVGGRLIGTLVNKSAVIEREIRAIHNPVGVAVAGSGIIQDQASAVQRRVAGIKMGKVFTAEEKEREFEL